MRKTCVGSPYYMSPEVCQDRPYNNKSDIWALGCVLYELCELKMAFGGSGSLMKTVQAIVSASYEPLSNHICQPIKFLVQTMLDSDPEKRPSTSQSSTH